MLWLLTARKDLPEDDNPWDPWYEKCHEMVVRAPNGIMARHIASENAGDEGKDAWIDRRYSTCESLLVDGESELIICHYREA
jgi:hypothetical protein